MFGDIGARPSRFMCAALWVIDHSTSLVKTLRGRGRTAALGLTLAGVAGVVQAGPLYLYSSNYYGSGGAVNIYDGVTGRFVAPFVSHASGGIQHAARLEIGPDGNLYVGSDSGDVVRRYSGYDGSYLGPFASGHGLGSPMDLTFGPDRNLYVTSFSANQIVKFDGTTGSYLGDFLSGTHIRSPHSMIFGPDGNAYVAMYEGGTVARFDGTTGAFIDDFVPAGSGGLFNPGHLVFAPDGSLLVGGGPGTIKQYAAGTGAYLGEFASRPQMIHSGPMHFGPAGDLFVADGEHNTINRFDGRTGAFLGDFIVPGSGGLQYNQDFFFSDRDIALIPEPATTALWLAGGLTLWIARRRAARI